MVNFSYRQMKEEEGRRIMTVDAFNMAKKKIQELTIKLNKANKDKKSAKATLQVAERQAKRQAPLPLGEQRMSTIPQQFMHLALQALQALRPLLSPKRQMKTRAAWLRSLLPPPVLLRK